MLQLLLVATLAAQALALPTPAQHHPRAEVRPQVKAIRMIGNVTDPALSRDSCGSTRINGQPFWTCRDTELCSNGECNVPVIVNSGSWSTMTWMGPKILASGPVGVASDGFNAIHKMFGESEPTEPFFPVLEDECPGSNAGFCDDGTRWAIWPAQPPMVAQTTLLGVTTAYTWIQKAHLRDLTLLNPNPAFTLYKTTHTPSLLNPKAMPVATVVEAEFWATEEIGFGAYGNVVKDGVAYLYGQGGSGTALAKVDTTSIEDRSQYQYYVNGAWTFSMPGQNDTSAVIDNAGAGGQGTFYWSSYYQSYIWIGQAGISGSADFYMTTAPSPEGPWIEPYKIYSGENGDSSIVGGYSLQAHPALLPSDDASENGIYLTWTQQWETQPYVTPLIWVDFQ